SLSSAVSVSLNRSVSTSTPEAFSVNSKALFASQRSQGNRHPVGFDEAPSAPQVMRDRHASPITTGSRQRLVRRADVPQTLGVTLNEQVPDLAGSHRHQDRRERAAIQESDQRRLSVEQALAVHEARRRVLVPESLDQRGDAPSSDDRAAEVANSPEAPYI